MARGQHVNKNQETILEPIQNFNERVVKQILSLYGMITTVTTSNDGARILFKNISLSQLDEAHSNNQRFARSIK